MKKLTLNALLIAFALVLSIVEHYFPLNLVVPIPGVKLGLPNVITLFALFYLDLGSCFAIVFIRCCLASLLVGNFASFGFSFTGGLFALIIMLFLKKSYNHWFSVLGISIAGAAAHNIGQILFATIIMKTISVFAYLPLLLVMSILTGMITGTVAKALFKNKILGKIKP
jgi:heptaprenyl diphosphate synthase